jgi:peroxiredoxin
LTSQQVSQLAKLARASESATAELHKASLSNSPTEALQSAVLQATQAEQKSIPEIVTPEQLQKLSGLLGEPFDTTRLKRIYPMAPELIPVEHWVNSQPLTLAGLRGKVVVIHFYAFQCHNCHANFEHYRRWHDEFGDDVVVLGIQTPETSRERDPIAVREAASTAELEFPILVDLESKNWDAWSNTMWPTVYIIDKNGYLRQWWQGELNWAGATGDQQLHQLINDLLQEDVGV